MVVVKKKRRKPAKVRKSFSSAVIRPVSRGNRKISMVLYGSSASGKTTLASTFPKKALIVCVEDGTLSVFDTKGLYYAEIDKSIQIVTDLAPKFSEYETIILDGVSSLQSLVLKEILGLDEIPIQNTWGMATRSDWMQVGIQVKEYLRLIMGQKHAHRVIIAQEREFDVTEDSEIVVPFVGPAVSPSIASWLNPEADYIGHTFLRTKTKEVKVKIRGKLKTKIKSVPGVDYCLRIGPNAVYKTKFRRPRSSQDLPEVIVDPTYKKIVHLIGGN